MGIRYFSCESEGEIAIIISFKFLAQNMTL